MLTVIASTLIRLFDVMLVAVIAGGLGSVLAAAYPERPIRWIVPLPSGGGVDIVARIIGQKVAEGLGQQIVIDNRPGAAGTLGTSLVAKAAPDGYTMLLGSLGPLAASPSLDKNLQYDPTKDFSPISLLVSFPNVLLVNPSSPFQSVNELIALAKARPGQIIYASSGVGTPPHLGMELFKQMKQLEILHVPYKGGPLAINDLLAGRVHLMFLNILTAAPYVKTNKLNALAISTGARSPVFPNLPTMAEAGDLQDFSIYEWVGLLAPAGVSPAIVNKMNAEVAKALISTSPLTKLRALGAEPVTNSPAEFASFIRAEITKWERVIRNAGISTQ